MKITIAVLLCSIALPVLSGCVSDDYSYDGRPYYSDSRGSYLTPEQRDRARAAWQRDKARREEIERQDEAAYREARDHRRFCRNSPSSMFCRYD